jgi:hypothetical protein
MMKTLTDYDSQNITISEMPWTNKGNDDKGRPEPKNKSRFNFKIESKEQALKCFKDFQDPGKFPKRIFAKIFYLQPENVFEKHADESAQAWHDGEEQRNKDAEANKIKRDAINESRKKR